MRLIVLLLCLAAVAGCDRQKPADQQGEAEAGVPSAGVDRSRRGRPAPDTMFKNPDGGDIAIADFEGVPVLVNLWATWCAPCVKELPTLDRLSGERDGELRVVTVSQDRAPQGSVVAFLDKLGTKRLGSYHDPEMALSAALGAEILPTSVLYDARGNEVWRFVGDLDWTGAEAERLLAEAR